MLNLQNKSIAFWGSWASIIALLLAIFIFVTGKENIKALLNLPSWETGNSRVFSQFSQIEYEYSGLLGLVGSPSSAKALNGKRVVAEAVVDFDGKLEPGSLETIKVIETHYDIYGKEVYKGILLFHAGFGGYTIEDEDAIVGKKPLQVFRSWPISN